MQAYDLTPTAWYPTFSDSPGKRKFRLLFFLDTYITNIDARNYLMDGLFAMYPEADRACKNPAHLFYGTNKPGQVLNDKALSLDLLFIVLESNKIKGGGRSRNIKPQLSGTQAIRKIGEIGASYSNTIGDTNKTTSQKRTEYFNHLKQNKRSKNIDWDKLEGKVRIFHDFMHSEQRLRYAQLVGLAQNLAWMKGGQKLYEARLQAFNATHTGNNPYPHDGRFELVRTFAKYNKSAETAYYPQRLINFSPYPSDARYRNLITAERDLLDRMEQIEPIQRMGLSHAEQYLDYKVEEAMDGLDNDIHLFRVPTGLGKTRRIKDMDEVILAFPTNDLKREVYDDRTGQSPAVTTPEFPTFTDPKLNAKIQRLLSAGFIKQVHRILWDIKRGKGCSTADQQIASNYLDQNRAAQQSVGSVFTTHARAIHSGFYQDTLIFDEDPLPLLLDVDTIKISDLKKLNQKSGRGLFASPSSSLGTLERFLEDVEPGDIIHLPDEYRIDISGHWVHVMLLEQMDSNLIKFLDCRYFYKDENDRDLIHFIHCNQLPTDKKIIIMSATAPVEVYSQLFGERLNVIDISDVTHTGTITQHTKYSYSRNSLATHLDQVQARLDHRPVITFKSFNEQFPQAAPDM